MPTLGQAKLKPAAATSFAASEPPALYSTNSCSSLLWCVCWNARQNAWSPIHVEVLLLHQNREFFLLLGYFCTVKIANICSVTCTKGACEKEEIPTCETRHSSAAFANGKQLERRPQKSLQSFIKCLSLVTVARCAPSWRNLCAPEWGKRRPSHSSLPRFLPFARFAPCLERQRRPVAGREEQRRSTGSLYSSSTL